jgi:hypothetical protein
MGAKREQTGMLRMLADKDPRAAINYFELGSGIWPMARVPLCCQSKLAFAFGYVSQSVRRWRCESIVDWGQGNFLPLI